jgi:acyl carrier protein
MDMVSSTTIHETITKLLSERVHVEVPAVDTDLMESGLLDSLTLVELMAGLEEEFGFSISFDEIELDNFRSVNRIADYVSDRSSVLETTGAI